MNILKPKNILIALSLLIHPISHAALDKAPNIDFSKTSGSFKYIERNLTKLDNAFYTAAPKNLNDGLTVGKLPNSDEIIALAKEIADGKHLAFDSVLIAHKDKLIFESYFAYGRQNLPHYQASASKGYTSFAVGRAIQMGYLSMEDLHKPVIHFLKDIDQENLTPGIEKITLHHTLSMRSGLRISDDKQSELLAKPELVQGQKLAQVYFTHSAPVTDDSQVYHYQRMDTRISMLVLEAVLPGTAKNFIKTELIEKLGITQYYWKDSVNGLPESAHSTSMTSRNMIKWGRLLKDNGKWQGKQLISKAFLKQATGSVAKPYDEDFDYSDYRYGYYFWGTNLNVGKKEFDTKIAWGGGTQMVIGLTELDLVIAITARARSGGSDTLEMLEQRILPTFVSAR